MGAPLGNAILILISSLQLGFLVASLADGSSLMWLKDDDTPIVMNGPQCLANRYNRIDSLRGTFNASTCHNESHTLRDVVKYPYGIGVLTDMYGRGWFKHGEDNQSNVPLSMTVALLKQPQPPYGQPLNNEQIYQYIKKQIADRSPVHHPADWLECDGMQSYGTCVAVFVFMAVVLLLIQFVVASLHQVPDHQGANLKLVTLIIQSLLCVFLIIATGVGGRMFTREFECTNGYIPRLTLNDHFDANFGIYFIGFSFLFSIGSLIVAFVMLDWAQSQEYAPEGQAVEATE